MAEYVYRAITRTGKEKKGNIEAEDAGRAVLRLRDMGLMPFEVKEATLFNRELEISFEKRVKPRDLSVFCRQFVSMISAGVTITEALHMLAGQTENKTMADAIRMVQRDIGKGESLSDAMKKHGKVFPSIMISMVAAGEASGKLETALGRMAEYFERENRIRGMIKKAAMYPGIVTLVALVVVIVMLVKVVPGYTALFEEMGIAMPEITMLVVHMSGFLLSYWYLIAAVLAAAVIGIRLYGHSDKGQRQFGMLARKVPIFGKMHVKKEASIFARTLSTLLCSGIPMVEAIGIVSAAMTNALYRDALKEAREEVMKGVPLSEPIRNSLLFPPMVAHMIKIGEEAGEIEEMMNRLADYYEEEVELESRTVMAALEPVIIIVMAVCVIFLIAALISPMMSMYSGLDHL